MKTEILSVVAGARIIKADLSSYFPDHNFSVTSDKSKNLIIIKWTLGQTDFKIREATEQILSDLRYLHGAFISSLEGVNVNYARLYPEQLVKESRQKIIEELQREGTPIPNKDAVNIIMLDELRHTAFTSADKYL